MRHAAKLFVLCAVGACGGSDGGAAADAEVAIDAPVNLDGTWPLMRVLALSEPVAPRATDCTEVFTTSAEPSSMTVAGMQVTLAGGAATNIMFGGEHHLAFDTIETWTAPGFDAPVTLRYTFDQTAETMLQGVVTAQPAWPDGACRYTYIIGSDRG